MISNNGILQGKERKWDNMKIRGSSQRLCSVKEVRCKILHIVHFHLYAKSRKGKFMEADSKLAFGGEIVVNDTKQKGTTFWGNGNVSNLDCRNTFIIL